VNSEASPQADPVKGVAHRLKKALVPTRLRNEVQNIPGVRERWGRDLLHCPYCHGHEVRGQALGLLGCTAESVQHALLIRQWSPDVAIFTNGGDLDNEQQELLAAHGVLMFNNPVVRLIIKDDLLHGVALADGTIVARRALFVRPKAVPSAYLLSNLGCDADENGWESHDHLGRTNTSAL
jgi:thioredoxin reductase